MLRIEPLRIQIFNGSFTTLLVLIVIRGRNKENNSVLAGVLYRDPPASDLLALHALVFPLSFPFGRLPRRPFPDEPSLRTGQKSALQIHCFHVMLINAYCTYLHDKYISVWQNISYKIKPHVFLPFLLRNKSLTINCFLFCFVSFACSFRGTWNSGWKIEKSNVPMLSFYEMQ